MINNKNLEETEAQVIYLSTILIKKLSNITTLIFKKIT